MDVIQTTLLITAAALAAVTTVIEARSAPLDPASIDSARYAGTDLPEGQSALAAKTQVLLDRAGASPGVIDGYAGENVQKAIRGFEEVNGLPVDGVLDEKVWNTLQAMGGDVIVAYTITEDDASKLSEEPLPEDYAKLAELNWLGFTSVQEKLAERFHMDVDFLGSLNPTSDFSIGQTIHVADPGSDMRAEVDRIVALKQAARLEAYDEAGDLVAVYPVTIGSSQTPSPSGTHQVEAVAIDPTYAYKPDENFVQGDNQTQLTLPPGPNGPVGSVWIDLSKPTYGIHGSADPSEIDKTASHGCVRMTNWDAKELAHMVSTGVPVEFRD